MWRRRFRRSLRVTRYRPDVARDVDDEIAFYLEMRTRELVASGMEPRAAAAAARAAFGDRDGIAAECRRLAAVTGRRRRLLDALASFGSDVRQGLRQLRHRPGQSAIILATWALTIGANAGIFQVVDGILLRPLPFPEPDDLVVLARGLPEAGAPRLDATLADYVAVRDAVPALASVAVFNKVSQGVGEPGRVRNVFSMHVTPSFFDVLGVSAARGQTLLAADAVAGAPRRVVISHDFWQGHFAGAADVVGRELVLDREPWTVTGVLPEGFLVGDWQAELWLPLTLPTGATAERLRGRGGFELIGRLAPGATLADVQGQAAAVDAETLRTVPPETRRQWQEGGYRTAVRRLHDDQVAAVRPALLLLWAGVLLVLVVGCVNIATLLLVRNTGRARELATRLAVGAGRLRVARQLVTESLVLAVVGGGVGIALGAWSLRFLELFEAYEIPRVGEVEIDPRSLAFVLLLTTVVGALAGLLPALATSDDDLHTVLRSGRMPGASGRRSSRLRGGLVAAQVAVAFVLTVAAALLVASLARLQAVDPGFDDDRVLAAATVMSWERFPTAAARNQGIAEMLAGLRAIPGVEEAAVASQLPFSGVGDQAVVTAEGSDGASAVPFATTVSPRYFATLGIPLLAGRAFTVDDSATSDPATIVDERLARRLWPEGGAVGRRLRLAGDRRATVVGVVGAIVQNDLAAPEPNGAIYFPARDSGLTFMRIAVATSVPPRTVVPAIRERLAAIDPEARLFWVQAMTESVEERLVLRRLPLFLLLAFAALAVFLATLGVYGVLAHSVATRTREIGLRLALGGTPRDVVALTLRRGLAVIAVGLAAGTVAAFVLTRGLASLLYEVRPNDPGVYALVAAGIAVVGSLACLVPARRATRVDPVPALRAD